VKSPPGRSEAIASAFERRAGRAEALAGQSAIARAPLRFAAGLFRAQAALAAAIEEAHAARPLCGRLADDLGAFAEALAIVLRFAAKQGPARLAGVAELRLAEDPRPRLAAFWREAGSGRDDYLSRALIRPYVEVLAAAGVGPDRARSAFGCPFCGGRPQIAWRASGGGEAEGAQRFLGCALCGGAWAAGRVRCAACDEGNPEKLPTFQSERHPTARIESCDSCRAYVKSIDLTVDARAVPEVDDLLSLSLDLWAEEQGLSRVEPGLAGV
jgi:formate dehydrogenase maturation protein FdhE